MVATGRVCVSVCVCVCVSLPSGSDSMMYSSSSLLSQRTGGSLQRKTDNTLARFNVWERKENHTIAFLFLW